MFSILCAGLDSNQRRPKPTRLQRVPFDRLGTDAMRLVCIIFAHATISAMKSWFSRVGTIIAINLLPVLALAQQGPIVPQNCSGPDCTICDLVTLAQNVINTGIFIAIFLSAILFAYAGWLYLTSGIEDLGDAKKARSMFKNVVFGLIIILGAWLIVDTIMRTLTGADWGPWNNLCS